MNLLAFESSAKAASVALICDGKPIGEYFQADGSTHSRTLLKMAEDLLRNCGLHADDLDATAVAIGPGSFTGLRIGIGAAKGVAWGREIPCIGVSTLEAMANCFSWDGVICCCMDARRAQVYNALFDVSGTECSRLCADRAIAVADLKCELEKIEKRKILVGDGANVCYNTLGNLPGLILPPQHLVLQRAGGVAACAWRKLMQGDYEPAERLIPNYIRPSQAEAARAEKE